MNITKILEKDYQFIIWNNFKGSYVVKILLITLASILFFISDGFCNKLLDAGWWQNTTIENIENTIRTENINEQDKEGITPLMYASYNGNTKAVELLLKNKAKIDIKTNSGETALLFACQENMKSVVEVLLKYNASKDIQDSYGFTALMLACNKGYREIVELLLKDKANANIQNNDGKTALMLASINRHKETVELLLKNGADVNKQGHYKTTALILASQKGYEEIVEILLKNGADIHLYGDNETSALVAASAYGHKEVVKLLLKYGAGQDVKNKNVALNIAKNSGHNEIVKLLQDKRKIENRTIKCLIYGLIILIVFCIKFGREVNKRSKNKQNTTQPETVIPKRHTNSSSKIKPQTNKTTKKSNSEDFDIQEIINCLDFEPFYTPNEKMLIMAEKGDKKTIEELLHVGADINSNNDKGITALMYASQEGHKDIVELLLQKGADITLKNHEGKTALDIAKDKGFTEIVTLLEKYRPKRRLEL